MQKTAVIDFDNTISGYDRWRGENILGPPVPYALDAIKEMHEWGWRIVIFTTRGNALAVRSWLNANKFPYCFINDTSHNPPNTSNKPIGEVYFDDRDAHCVGEMPYNWHKAMARVRRRYQPQLDTFIDDASAWASWWIRYFVAPGVRRDFARELPLHLDLRKLREDGKGDVADAIECEAYADPFGM